MHTAEGLHSKFVSEQFNAKKKIIRRNSGTVKFIERKGSGALLLNENNSTSCQLTPVQKAKVSENQTPDILTNAVKQLEPGLFTESDNATASCDVSMELEHVGDIDNSRKLLRMKCMVNSGTITTVKVQEETSLNSTTDELIEEVLVVQKVEAQHSKEKAIRNLKEIRESNKSVNKESIEREDTLYSASDYTDASGEVLVMMQRTETQHQRKKSIAILKERKESEKSAEKPSIEQEDTLYSASDYADASGEVLVMMQRAEAQHQRKKAMTKFVERKESEKSVEKPSIEQEDTLYSASDYADASGEVLVMMQKAEAQHQRKKAMTKFVERKESEKSVEKPSIEQEDTLYSASDYADASGEVLVMMQKAEAQHQRKKAMTKFVERKESEKSVEKPSIEQEDTLYSASDYADASGEVLVMMQKAEAQHQRKKAMTKFVERKESEKSVEKPSIEQEDTLYSASDYADASGEVLVMMQKAEAQHQRKKAMTKFVERKESEKSVEKPSIEQEDTLYSASDYADASGEVLVMMQKAEAQHQRKKAMTKFVERKESEKSVEKPSIEQEDTLYSASDYADASGEVLVMMQRAEAQHQRKKAVMNLKKMQESQKISQQDTTSGQQNTVNISSDNNVVSETAQKTDAQEERETAHNVVKEEEITKTVHVKPSSLQRQFFDTQDYVDSPDEIFSSPGLSRTVGTNSLRDLKVSSNDSESSQGSHDAESSPVEQRIDNISSDEPRTKTIQTIVKPANSAFSESHRERDLISSLPEEDQASQVARNNTETTEVATVHFQTHPIEISYQEPEYSLCYLSSSGDDSYETNSDIEDLDPSNPNNSK